MRIEDRADGAKIMRPGTGKQRLLVASTHQAELVIVCQASEVVSCRRHYDESLRKTVPCDCVGPCYSQRLDRFLGVIYRAGPTIWDERVLCLPAMGWGSLQTTAVARGFDPNDILGYRCVLRRMGGAANGRTTCEVQDRVKIIPAGFDLLAGVRNCTGIATNLWRDWDGDAFPQAIPPARTRQEKPRVPLGRQHGQP